jgi:hypothetical protein
MSGILNMEQLNFLIRIFALQHFGVSVMNRFSLLVLLGVLTAGVGLWPVTGALAATDRDACAMLQKADVETAFFPRKFDSGKPGYAVKSSETRAAVSSCTYTSRGATIQDMVTVTLAVRRAPNSALAITPEAVRASAVQRKTRPVDVAGLGKGAYWVNIGSIAYPVFELNVFRGKREWLVFSSGARTLDKSAVLDGLKKIAKVTVARK